MESFVKSHGALRIAPSEGQGEEGLGGHTRNYEPGDVFEAELGVVIRMAHKTTASSMHVFQL